MMNGANHVGAIPTTGAGTCRTYCQCLLHFQRDVPSVSEVQGLDNTTSTVRESFHRRIIRILCSWRRLRAFRPRLRRYIR